MGVKTTPGQKFWSQRVVWFSHLFRVIEGQDLTWIKAELLLEEEPPTPPQPKPVWRSRALHIVSVTQAESLHQLYYTVYIFIPRIVK